VEARPGDEETYDAEKDRVTAESGPLREELLCPKCGRQHIDRRWWAHNAHTKHNCLFTICGHVWKEDHASIGVKMPAAEPML